MKKLIICIILFIIMITVPVYSANEETLIIFDASLSMNEKFYNTQKYVAAIEEAKSVLSKMDSSNKIGLRTIGVKLNLSILNYIQDPGTMCTATQLDVPIRTNSIEYIINSLDEIFPLGTTPLEYTLRLSINNDFIKGNQLKHIILVTDGAESCDGDPCRFIKEFMRNRNDIRIDIIAISVNPQDFLQLKCLSDTTNGIIINASNPRELKSAYNKVLTEFSTNTDTTYNKPKQNNVTYKNYHFETYD